MCIYIYVQGICLWTAWSCSHTSILSCIPWQSHRVFPLASLIAVSLNEASHTLSCGPVQDIHVRSEMLHNSMKARMFVVRGYYLKCIMTFMFPLVDKYKYTYACRHAHVCKCSHLACAGCLVVSPCIHTCCDLHTYQDTHTKTRMCVCVLTQHM